MFRQGILAISLLSCISSGVYAVTSNNEDITEKFALAQALADKGEIAQAISAYQSLIRQNPQLPEAYNNLASLYLQQKNTEQAKQVLEQGLHAHKGYGRLYESLSAINVAMAREAYSKALQIDLKPATIEIASLSLNEKNKQADTAPAPVVLAKTEPAPILASSKVADKTAVVENKEKPGTEAPRVDVIKPDIRLPERVNEQNTSKANTISTTSEPIDVLLQAWAASWSAQEVDMYLSFYHSQYNPSNGLTLKTWKQSRRLRLKKPEWIKVALSELNVEKNNGKQAIVKFKQSYESNTFHEISLKRMVLLYTENGWRIFHEKSL
ncbi:MAG: tetratricopeptide repeat protein [Gammaproteobacteria bacterium]|nr:tetratricopeptide repeat protein [Gammaproteobacteria bacterium]